MTTPQPNHQKLLITGKGKSNSISGTDGRIIEQWANEGIVRKINAGTNITTDPANGVDMGQGITINAMGGGSGNGPYFIDLYSGMDEEAGPAGSFSPGSGIFIGPNGEYSVLSPSSWTVFNTSDAAGYTFASSWIVFPSSGQSVSVLPEITMPAYTYTILHGPCSVTIVINAWGFDSVNAACYASSIVQVPPSASTQPPSSDYNPIFTMGSDLSLVSGTGFIGTGIVSAGTEAAAYIGSTQVTLNVPVGVTFT
jgi:hypothetical protein